MSCRISQVMSYIWMSHVMSDLSSHVIHMNESCHTYEWVMSHVWISHVMSDLSSRTSPRDVQLHIAILLPSSCLDVRSEFGRLPNIRRLICTRTWRHRGQTRVPAHLNQSFSCFFSLFVRSDVSSCWDRTSRHSEIALQFILRSHFNSMSDLKMRRRAISKKVGKNGEKGSLKSGGRVCDPCVAQLSPGLLPLRLPRAQASYGSSPPCIHQHTPCKLKFS